ncbi:zf-HC2 domain-containing protein [Aquibacillus sp. 3ASR75-11]|uniref:Anti-sigma-W factor RsiW n=1 Tax=Terrihalobacillus insolitus TaxID=2950438 RepID=A0A9X3WV03_9BACI|nr:zf-HC2 domain-containing protein [Terrihalobacillus insolitus]MDC3414787.1 zf-HC2 domain-containing protein [Terrihalobacillus insolitus]MDC3426150.1 zf-HC2 domain-containing protein [Terrihalobacillus insolitus]
MACNKEAIKLMHQYLDDELSTDDKSKLQAHLKSCTSCQQHYQELKKTNTYMKSMDQINVPHDFTRNVMNNLPKEPKRVGYKRWMKTHPIVTAAAIFFVLMFAGLSSVWNGNSQLTVSKQKDLVIENNTVTVPEGVTVDGDLVVKNGDLIIEGTVKGDVVLINGKLISDQKSSDPYLAAAIGGELKQIDQIFDWVWYNIKKSINDVFSFKVNTIYTLHALV